MKKDRNYLLESVIDIVKKGKRGKVLDLGCGDGDYSKRLKELGFEVIAADLDEERFKYSDEIVFKNCDITETLPFPDKSFGYVLFLEVIEHLRNPYSVIKELHRILNDEGKLILSTPNILNLKSRMRFLIEGAFEFFREPPLDQMKNPKEKIYNLHVVPYRIHELEYLMHRNGFIVENLFTSRYENFALSFLLPLIKLQLMLKGERARRKGNISFSRINKILLSKELLFGRHLVLEAKKSIGGAGVF